jgi:hypothetical protein
MPWRAARKPNPLFPSTWKIELWDFLRGVLANLGNNGCDFVK